MAIKFERSTYHSMWLAVDDDIYDGAPDATGEAALQGWGATMAEAEKDYHDKLDEIRGEKGHDEEKP